MRNIMQHRHAIRAMRSYVFRRRFQGLRSLPNLLVASIPTLIAGVAATHGVEDPYGLYGQFIVPICIYFALPFMCMFTVLPILADLYDNASIGYFYTRPTPRWATMLGILQGSLLVILPILALAAILPGLMLALSSSGASDEAWGRRLTGLTAVLWLGCFAYSSICLVLGVWFKRAILWAAFFLLGWGAFFGGLPGSMRFTSPHRYLLGLAREWCQVQNTWTGMFTPDADPPSAVASISVILFATVGFFLLAAIASRHRDVL
jgi:ABC-type transport system involved in multi-copper enzyme maturation permease subunit